MVLRHPWSLSALLFAGAALTVAPPRSAREAATSPRHASRAICPAGPSGAEPDVMGPSAAVPDYAVSVTPKGGSATWPVNTNGHTAAFTVTNTGNCDGTYTFTSRDSGPISGVTLDKTSKFLLHGQSTPVTATYNVGGAGSGVLTVRASGYAIADSGWYNVTAVV